MRLDHLQNIHDDIMPTNKIIFIIILRKLAKRYLLRVVFNLRNFSFKLNAICKMQYVTFWLFQLAKILKNKIDPTIEEKFHLPKDTLLEMKSPLIIYCQLPGDLYFFTIKKPGKEIDRETACNFMDYVNITKKKKLIVFFGFEVLKYKIFFYPFRERF